METITPQNISGCWVTSSGPGWTPCTIIEDIIRAVIGAKGMPSASSGTIEAVAAALLAVSGPATPSTAPSPISVRYFETAFSRR